MPKQFQLKIADPCHEDWNKMTTSEKGKYCGSCQKQVIDFTGMTDTQLAAFFKKPSSGSMCGRFFDDQLDRRITVPRKQIPWIKYFFQFTIPLFLASCTGNRTKGKVAAETVQNESSLKKNLCRITTGMIIPPAIEEVQFADAYTLGEIELVEPVVSDICSSKVVASDKDEIRLADSIMTKEEIKEENPHAVALKSDSLRFEVPDSLFLNDTLWATTGLIDISYYDKREPEILTDSEAENNFKVYANPARSNSNVFIDARKSEDGIYAIQLLNFSGQLIRQDQVRIGKGMGAITFAIPSIPSGNYLVVLLNKKTGKATTEKLVVQ